MNYGSPTMWKNGVLLPTYPTFVVLKNDPFLKFSIGGGISILVHFCQNFWSIFWTLPFDDYDVAHTILTSQSKLWVTSTRPKI
ncbi:hypothetical protein PFNF54_02422 [Plasmodium falciparum NF54]|uniref:Uncharacterized protein n=1 Tax=Plasmodium falciparum (isolate NF54) TaxID=5843 RepID=W7JUY8_PLAFO|nr:hypothetical protein PFNF54_02422 [Plasmodium falciparum NF54]